MCIYIILVSIHSNIVILTNVYVCVHVWLNMLLLDNICTYIHIPIGNTMHIVSVRRARCKLIIRNKRIYTLYVCVYYSKFDPEHMHLRTYVRIQKWKYFMLSRLISFWFRIILDYYFFHFQYNINNSIFNVTICILLHT